MYLLRARAHEQAINAAVSECAAATPSGAYALRVDDGLAELWREPRGGLSLSFWVGSHPDDGDRFSHLLIHPRRPDLSGTMTKLAHELGIARVCDAHGRPSVVPITAAWCSIMCRDDTPFGVVNRPDGGIANRVDPLWVDAARSRGHVLLTVGLDQMDVIGSVADLDGYLRRDTTRIFAGFLTVA